MINCIAPKTRTPNTSQFQLVQLIEKFLVAKEKKKPPTFPHVIACAMSVTRTILSPHHDKSQVAVIPYKYQITNQSSHSLPFPLVISF